MSIVPKDWTPTSSAIFYTDAHDERARAAGAEIVRELEAPHYGDRVYGCLDVEGHAWYFGRRVDDAAWKATTEDSRI